MHVVKRDCWRRCLQTGSLTDSQSWMSRLQLRLLNLRLLNRLLNCLMVYWDRCFAFIIYSCSKHSRSAIPSKKNAQRTPEHHELTFTFAICRRPSVCLSSVCVSSVCNVRAPYSNDWNVFTSFGTLAICLLPGKLDYVKVVGDTPILSAAEM